MARVADDRVRTPAPRSPASSVTTIGGQTAATPLLIAIVSSTKPHPKVPDWEQRGGRRREPRVEPAARRSRLRRHLAHRTVHPRRCRRPPGGLGENENSSAGSMSVANPTWLVPATPSTPNSFSPACRYRRIGFGIVGVLRARGDRDQQLTHRHRPAQRGPTTRRARIPGRPAGR